MDFELDPEGWETPYEGEVSTAASIAINVALVAGVGYLGYRAWGKIKTFVEKKKAEKSEQD
jgi:uncharacterized membrane protein